MFMIQSVGGGRTISDEVLTFYQGNILVELVLRQVFTDRDLVVSGNL